jgi:hypothetical protein
MGGMLVSFHRVSSYCTKNLLFVEKRMINSKISMAASSSSSGSVKPLVVEPFAFRQFREHAHAHPGYTGTVVDISVEKFEQIVNERYREQDLKPGYAPFCKHLFIENDFTHATVNVLKITPENEEFLRTKYEARNEKELPVLIRYFPKESLASKNIQFPKAKYLDLILYSREQIRLENAAQQSSSSTSSSTTDPEQDSSSPWGIVSIKAQDLDRELPMNPITNMRNALGKEHGGSGIPLDRTAYMECVEYWKDHAVVS